MTTTVLTPSGSADGSGGAAVIPNTPNPDTVAYDTYRKVLSEKKKRDEENIELKKSVDEFQAKEKAREEEELKKQKNYEQLLKNRDDELAKERQEKMSLRGMVENGIKRRALMDAIPGSVPEQYWALMPLGDVALNPETGEPDELSVQKIAQDFTARFPHIIERGGKPKLPGEAAKGMGAKITYDEWLKLPLKDQKARLKEVI